MNKRVTSRAVYDIETGQCLERDSYLYEGQWASLTPPALRGEDEGYWYGAFYLPNVVRGISAAALTAVLFTSLLAGQLATAGDEQIPAGNLSAPTSSQTETPDPVLLIRGSDIQVRYTFEGDDLPIAEAPGQPDEDYWQNPVPPVPASLFQSLPYLPDAEEIPAASLFGQPDEDFWQSGVAPVSSYPLPVVFRDDDVVVEQPAGVSVDEDYWQNAVLPVAAGVYQNLPYLPDPDADGVPTAPAAGPPDEDYWASPVAPIAGANLWPQPWSFDTAELVPVQPVEDYMFWIAASGYPLPPRIYSEDDVLVAPPPTLGLDEDYWINGVAPIPARNLLLFPYVPDPEAYVPTPPIPPGAVQGRSARLGHSFPAMR